MQYEPEREGSHQVGVPEERGLFRSHAENGLQTLDLLYLPKKRLERTGCGVWQLKSMKLSTGSAAVGEGVAV